MKQQEKSEITTIKLKKKTKERMDKLRMHDRESYDHILQRILSILNLCRNNPDEAQGRLIEIERYTKKIALLKEKDEEK